MSQKTITSYTDRASLSAMAFETLIEELSPLRSEIAGATRIGNQLATIVPYRLLPFIDENPVLKEAYEARLHYYERLKQDSEYQSLRERILASINNLYWACTKSKLPKGRSYFLPKSLGVEKKYDPVTKEHWREEKENLNPQQFYDALSRSELWCDLGEGSGVRFQKDSRLCRWRATIDQFRAVDAFLTHAKQSGAISEAGLQLIPDFRSLVSRLERMLEEPWQREHIEAFEELDQYIHTRTRRGIPRSVVERDDESIFKAAKQSSLAVCDALIQVVKKTKKSHSGARKGRKPRIRYLGNDVLKFGDTEYKMAKDSYYAKLSQKIYETSQVVGEKVPIAKVWGSIGGSSYEPYPSKDWERLSSTITTANRWAKKEKLPQLFRCESKFVYRMV